MNTKTLILRAATADSPLSRPAVARIWQQVTGAKIDKRMQEEYFGKYGDRDGELTYVTLEEMMMNELVADGTLVQLNAK